MWRSRGSRWCSARWGEGLSGGGHGTEAWRAELGSRGAGLALFPTQEQRGPDFLGGVFLAVVDGKRFPTVEVVRRLLLKHRDGRGPCMGGAA